jgi:hypothetical protein
MITRDTQCTKREGAPVIIADFPNLHLPHFPLSHQLILFQILIGYGIFPLSHDNCGTTESQDRTDVIAEGARRVDLNPANMVVLIISAV